MSRVKNGNKIVDRMRWLKIVICHEQKLSLRWVYVQGLTNQKSQNIESLGLWIYGNYLATTTEVVCR